MRMIKMEGNEIKRADTQIIIIACVCLVVGVFIGAFSVTANKQWVCSGEISDDQLVLNANHMVTELQGNTNVTYIEWVKRMNVDKALYTFSVYSYQADSLVKPMLHQLCKEKLT